MKKAPVAVVISVACLAATPASGILTPVQDAYYVSRVIDGDTLELEGGERVRLLGIDTPEKGQYLYQEAKDWLSLRVMNREVTLERGREDRDKYGRLLRYVRLDPHTLANLELVKLGYASTYMLQEGDPYCSDLLRAEGEAREKGLGIWQHTTKNVFCIGIHYMHYNARGDDNDNLNDEYIELRNKCEHPVELTRHIIRDHANNTFMFSQFTLDAKSVVAVHTGQGENNQTDMYWQARRAIWNNAGDTFRMWNPDGELLLEYTYK